MTKQSRLWIVGIDEVGRGALAGPVVVAAVSMPRKIKIRNAELGNLRDSKKLTPRLREEWLGFFKNRQEISYAIARVYPRQIEKNNITGAANLAALRATKRLVKNCGLKIENCSVFLDGGLFLGNGEQPKNSKTIVGGDEKFTAIKIASIVAKVYRDKLMLKLAKKYPSYGFDVHKGYGTRQHISAVKKHGPSPAHRSSFDPIKKIMYNVKNND